jgi:hypothetical protein
VNTYNPGQSVRLSVVASVLGVLANPDSLTAIVQGPDGTQLSGAVVQDSTGNFHADIVLPLTAASGPWVGYWYATGALPSSNGITPTGFLVNPLAFTPP